MTFLLPPVIKGLRTSWESNLIYQKKKKKEKEKEEKNTNDSKPSKNTKENLKIKKWERKKITASERSIFFATTEYLPCRFR